MASQAEQLIVETLREAGGPLEITAIRRELRAKGRNFADDFLERICRTSQIIRPAGQNRFGLLSHVANEGAQSAVVASPQNESSLVHFSKFATGNYVAFDIETTGRDPNEDTIIQIGAVRIRSGRVSEVFFEVANPGRPLSPALRRLLRIPSDSKLDTLIQAGPEPRTITARFAEFAGDDLLVAHNGEDFDCKFLESHGFPRKCRVLDTLELAFVVVPSAPNHRLRDLAESLNAHVLDPSTQVRLNEVSALDGAAYHNALFDAAIASQIAEGLRERLCNDQSEYGSLLSALLPELSLPSVSTSLDVLTESLAPSGFPSDAPLSPILEDGDIRYEDAFRTYLDAAGREVRAGQLQMVELVGKTLDAGGIQVIEAPTGTGKSLGLSFPAAIHARRTGKPVLIATRTKNLQDQLQRDVASLRSLDGVAVRHTVLKGRANYLCVTALVDLVSDVIGSSTPVRGTPLSDRVALAVLAGWAFAQARTAGAGELDTISHAIRSKLTPIIGFVNQVRAERGRCRDDRCRASKGCYRAQAKARARQSELVICNHSLWLSPGLSDLPLLAGVLLDEAHELEDAATASWTEEVTRQGCDELLAEILAPGDRLGFLPRVLKRAVRGDATDTASRGAISATREARLHVPIFGDELGEFLRRVGLDPTAETGATLRFRGEGKREFPTRWQKLSRSADLLGQSLKDVGESLNRLASACEASPTCAMFAAEASFLSGSVLETARVLTACLARIDEAWVAWCEARMRPHPAGVDRIEWAIRRAPLSVAAGLRERCSSTASLVLTSATLAIRGRDFGFLLERIGLSELVSASNLHQLPAAFDYRNALLLMPRYLDHVPQASSMPFFVEESSKELEHLFEFTEGRGLVLFTARARLEEVCARIQAPLTRHGVSVLAQTGESSREALRSDFRDDEHSVLLGLKSFWQGIDVPGPSCSVVVIEKVPFPYGDPVIEARREAISARGGAEFEDYLLPLALIGFKQGFGRLLRSPTDRGVVVLLDRRIHSRAYKQQVLDTLPGYSRRPEVENSRVESYRAISEHLPHLFRDRDIDTLLGVLPERWLSKAETALRRMEIPDVVPDDFYDSVRPVLMHALQEVFGHSGFRSHEQEQIVRSVLAGRDVVGLLPTGAGKSLAFQLPAVLRQGLTLVVSPLIALMRDQVDKMHALRLDVVAGITSHMSAGERDEVLRRVREGRVRLLYVSPERLRDPQLQAALATRGILQLVVDEAHCISMWGPSFRPEYVSIASALARLGLRPPILAVTATATVDVTADIIRRLEMRDSTVVRGAFDRPELTYSVYERRSAVLAVGSQNDKFRNLLALARTAERCNELMVVYAATTRRSEEVARKLSALGVPARAYHGQMPADERSEVQELFLDDHLTAVVATKAFGMGIDKPDIRYVVHYDVPGDIESYLQESGRAGRDRQRSYAVLFFHRTDVKTQDWFIETGSVSGQFLDRLSGVVKRSVLEGKPVDAAAVAEELDVEDFDVRVGLFWLEEAQRITEVSDVTLAASLTLLSSEDEIIDLPLPRVSRKLLSALLGTGTIPAFRRIVVNVLDLAVSVAASPEDVELAFVQLASLGAATFRPFSRGTRYTAGPQFDTVIAGSDINAQFAARRRAKLDQMVSYALARHKCRRGILLEYLGEPSRTGNCGGCDVCVNPLPAPWTAERMADLANPAVLFEPHTVALQAVEANVARAKEENRSPLGRETLRCILRGNAYPVVSRERDPWQRKWKDRRLRSFAQWGILAGVPGGDEAINKVFARLVRSGFVTEVEGVLGDGGRYQFLRPTERGLQALEAGVSVGVSGEPEVSNAPGTRR